MQKISRERILTKDIGHAYFELLDLGHLTYNFVMDKMAA